MRGAGLPVRRARAVASLRTLAVVEAVVLSLGACRDVKPDQREASTRQEARAEKSEKGGGRSAARKEPTGHHPDPSEDGPSLAAETLTIEEVLSLPGLSGAPRFEAQRQVLLSRAKNEPVFFVRTPELAPASEEIAYYRFRLESARSAWTALSELLPYFEDRPDKGRLTLLREGYLYAEDPDLAFALVSLVGAHHLFDSPGIWVQRGGMLMRAQRRDRRYVFEDGPYRGQRVQLFLLDRVGPGTTPETPPLHRDFRTLRYRLAFDRARVRHVTEDRLVAELRYSGRHWVSTLLRAEGPDLFLEVEEIEPAKRRVVLEAQEEARNRLRALRALQVEMWKQVRERLPFDEPHTEVGQQDGILRRAWLYAYQRGWSSFHVYDDRYPVFDEGGAPLVPQVCIDYLLDTFERASGTWWAARHEGPRRLGGTLDFDDLAARDELRRSRHFVRFAEEHPEWFDVLEVPEEERVELGRKKAFFDYLAEHADDFQPADMVFIRGTTPWDTEAEHTHSFFVYDTDPMSGVPIAVAGNAAFPAIWSWETEARRTPLRTLRYRIRPTKRLLDRVLMNKEPPSMSPPLLMAP